MKTTGEFQAGSNGNGVGVVSVNRTTSVLEIGTTLSLGDGFPGDGGGGAVTNGSQAYIRHFTGSIGLATIGNSSPATS